MTDSNSNAWAPCARPRARIDLIPPPGDFVPTLSANALIGSSFKFEVTFDNTLGANPGYGPYLDIIFPASGGTGISFNQGLGATLGGLPITATLHPFTGTTINHPFTQTAIPGQPGDQLVVIELPFSSYAPQQPPASVIVNAQVSSLAGINQSLFIKVQAGFRYACSGIGNGFALPNMLGDDQSGIINTALFTIDKKYDGEQIGPQMGETATGPNFPHRYAIVVNVAAGQTIQNLKITDTLPNNLAFKSLLPLYPPNGMVSGALPLVGIPANNNTLTVMFPQVTGTGGTTGVPDAKVEFEFFIPDKDAAGAWVVDPSTGASATSLNQAMVEGTWGGVLQTLDPVFYTLVCKSIALQKRANNTSKSNADVNQPQTPTDNAPGDIISYTLDFQVSDYFTFSNLTVEDLLSDGQIFWNAVTYTPKYSLTDQTQSTTSNFAFGNPIVTNVLCGNFANGRRKLVFSLPGTMTGGMAVTTTPSTVPATGKITFYSKIAESYVCPKPSGDASVDQNDKLFNRATVKGTFLNNTTSQPVLMQDDDQVDFRLLIGLPAKSVHAITDRFGATTFSPPLTSAFAPGDKITFRMKYDLVHGDIEKLALTDFPPLPVLTANQFSTAPLSLCSGSGIPAVNTACIQPLSWIVPSRPNVSAPPVNSLRFDYGTFDDPASPPLNLSKDIDLLFTLEIQPDPFVDGLTVSNQLMSQESNSFNEQTNQVTLALFKVAEPRLKIRKGVVATNNPCGQFTQPSGSPACAGTQATAQAPPNVIFSLAGITSTTTNPINSGNLANLIQSDLQNVDAGDVVTFAVVVENVGSSPYGAFDVKVTDNIPSGFTVLGGVTARNGAGATIPFTGNLFSTAGMQLSNASSTLGSLAANSPNSGQNIAVITYTLQVDASAGTCGALTNTATVRNYSSVGLGPNFAHPITGIAGQYSATRTVTIGPTISKTLVTTDQSSTAGTNVTIGELITYQVTVNLPEGTTPSLTLLDIVPAGLQATSVAAINSPNYPLPTPTVSTLPNACGSPFSLGINFNSPINVPVDNNPLNNSFTFQVTARVCNVPTNIGFQPGQNNLNNSIMVSSGACTSISNAVLVTVVEPRMTIAKQVTPSAGPVNSIRQITLTVTNTGNSPAFDVDIQDPLPTGIAWNITTVTTPPGWTFSVNASGVVKYLSNSGTSILPNAIRTFVFRATVTHCGQFTNTATIAHATTIPGPSIFERDEPPTSSAANVIVNGPPCPCAPRPSNLVNWWRFDEAAGTIANDLTSSPFFNNAGTYGPFSAAPIPTAGGVGNFLCFDGQNDYVSVLNHPEVNFAGNCTVGAPTESFTIDFWIQTSSANAPIIDKRTAAGPLGYYVYLSGGRIHFQMNGNVFPTPSSGPIINNNLPHFVAITVPRCTTTPAAIYVDGVQVTAFTAPPLNLMNGSSLMIGKNAIGLSGYLRGCLDELEIFKRALAANEIQLIYGAGRAGKCKG